MEPRPLTYESAERAFRELERLRQDGQISADAYRAQLNTLRVLDEQGRTWMLQEGSGQWFVYHNEAWMAATPPGREARAQEVVQRAPPARATAARRGSRHRNRATYRLGCVGLTLRMLLWDLLWIGFGYLVYQFASPRMPWLMVPLAVLAAVSLVWWIRRLTPRSPQGAQS